MAIETGYPTGSFSMTNGCQPEPSTETYSVLTSWRNLYGVRVSISCLQFLWFLSGETGNSHRGICSFAASRAL